VASLVDAAYGDEPDTVLGARVGSDTSSLSLRMRLFDSGERALRRTHRRPNRAEKCFRIVIAEVRRGKA
jgi:hypothetical protein